MCDEFWPGPLRWKKEASKHFCRELVFSLASSGSFFVLDRFFFFIFSSFCFVLNATCCSPQKGSINKY